MNYGRHITKCRMCSCSDLYEFLDLGFFPAADGILSEEEMDEPEILFPLKVTQCQNCGLTQLTYAPNPEILYGDKYKYEASITQTGRTHFKEMAKSIIEKFELEDDSLVVDIGSNVGVLLEEFRNNGMRVVGVDPAPTIAAIANAKGIKTLCEFMNPFTSSRITDEGGKAKIVTGTNVFAHIDDKVELIASLSLLLDDDGVFIIEVPYFVDLVDNLEYDTIYVDHLEYLTIKPLYMFFKHHKMKIFDIEKRRMHGGTLRVFVCFEDAGWAVGPSVAEFLDLENEKKIYEKETLDTFARRVNFHRQDFVNLLSDLKTEGKSIVGISAPAKGNTLLNYCKIGPETIDYMTEKAEIKIGHYTPGMHIPIVSEERILEDKPDYGIIFAWNFADEIMANNREFLANGGKFIIPIPSPIVIDKIQEGVKIRFINPVFEDDRGIITDLLNEKVNHVGLITTEKGAIRGNHYHTKSTQYSYVLSGAFEVITAPVRMKSKQTRRVVKQGEMIIIPPNYIHRFKALEKTVIIDIVSESREGTGFEDDVFRVDLQDS